MANVWKIGSRWGNRGPSVLDLFMEYGCVFLGGKSDSGVGDWGSVQKGDLFIISDGSVAVAIGESLGKFQSYEDTGIRFRTCDSDEFIDDQVVLCPARLVLLKKEEREDYWGIDPRKRFCRAPGASEKVCAFWAEKCKPQKNEPFDIVTHVATLLDESDPDRVFHPSVKYAVPIFQRPYTWGENELRRLMEDLHQGLLNQDPVFMGTIQLSQPILLSLDGSVRSYKVIDGQQRLTTFILLLSILEKLRGWNASTFEFARANFRTSVNKRAAQDDLDAFFRFFEECALTDEVPQNLMNNPYIANARILYGLLQEFASSNPEIPDESDQTIASDEQLADYAVRMHEFLTKNIKLVVIETHAGLSKTLKIFNTINSSGLDLGSEDLFKVRFYEYLQRQGDSEDVFDKISEVYETIEEYNRHPLIGTWLSMSHILSSYQRVLVARCDLNATVFSMSQETFFERLFDTVLGVHVWDDFKEFSNAIPKDSPLLLSIDDLRCLVHSHIAYLKECERDPELKIIRMMFWETRYGYAWDFPVLAMFNGIVDTKTVKEFALGLFKSLVPPSLYFAKHVYHGRACLLEFLKSLWKGDFNKGDSVVKWCGERWHFNGLSLMQMTETALDYQVAWIPKWKNLLCRLVEYLTSKMKDESLFERLFTTCFDIEHIQSYTDETDQDRVWSEWEEEINKIGNLSMFERTLNREVHNHADQKVEAYGRSSYKSLEELKTKVLHWTKEDAITRRKKITKDICEFLFQD